MSILINLELLRALMVEFIAERESAGDLTRALTLSEFLLWLQTKETTTNGKERPDSRVQGVLRLPQRGREGAAKTIRSNREH